jgi:hypothetical protein
MCWTTRVVWAAAKPRLLACVAVAIEQQTATRCMVVFFSPHAAGILCEASPEEAADSIPLAEVANQLVGKVRPG